jgi:hypothetical protein
MVLGRPANRVPTPQKVLDSIGLDLAQWQIARVENTDRSASGPDGQNAVVTDRIIALIRHASA